MSGTVDLENVTKRDNSFGKYSGIITERFPIRGRICLFHCSDVESQPLCQSFSAVQAK